METLSPLDENNTSQKGHDSQEDTQLLTTKDGVKTYKRRWYILALFSFFSILQTAVWGTFSPIARSSMFALHWTTVNITLLVDLSDSVFILTCVPVIWILNTKGMRFTILICASCITVAASMRCLTIDPVPATWLATIGAMIDGVPGVLVFAAPSFVSVTWFPVQERTTATAIISSSSYVGDAMAFIIGPLLVRDAPAHFEDVLQPANNFSLGVRNSNNSLIEEELIRNDILRLLYIGAGICAIMLLLVVIYFPDKPPSPPSITASTSRTEYKKGLKKLLTSKRFMIIALAYSLPTGVYLAWTATLTVNLDAVGISQIVSGWIGFISIIGGCVAGVLLSRITDMFIHHLKTILLTLFCVAAVMTLIFLLLWEEYIPFNKYLLYITCILGGVCINGSIPLFYELSCEAAYPVGESVAVGIIVFLNQIWGITFLSLPLIPNIGVSWMNWCLLVSATVPIPLLAMLDAKYTRSDIDTGNIVLIEPNNSD